jgi:hypothetical protein
MTDRNVFRRTELRAFELLGEARSLIGQDYWLFLGITVVGILIASIVPLQILLGPMMVGIHMALAAKQRGDTVEFGILFKGFDKFAESLIATLIVVIGALVVMSPALVIFAILMVALGDGGGDTAQMLLAMVAILFYVSLLVIAMVISALTMFVYPLIADRDISGVEAVKLSIQGARANLWGVVRVLLVNSLLGLVGSLVCCVGVFFVLPFSMALTWLTYRQIFPAQEASA